MNPYSENNGPRRNVSLGNESQYVCNVLLSMMLRGSLEYIMLSRGVNAKKESFFALVYSAHTSTSYYVNGKALGVFTRVRPIVEFLDFQQMASSRYRVRFFKITLFYEGIICAA